MIFVNLFFINCITLSGIVARPISSFLCCPVAAVTAISLNSFRIPFKPLASKNLPNFSPTVSAGSKSHTSRHSMSSADSLVTGLKLTFVLIALWMLLWYTYRAKCSSQIGFRHPILTELLYRRAAFDCKYNVTKGSLRPFESFGRRSFASITSTLSTISGGSCCSTVSNKWWCF